MLVLRLTQNTEGQGKYRLDIELVGDGLARQTATARFNFELTAQDQEKLRWYLEDYLQYSQDPAPIIARGIEKRIADIGVQLFKILFQSNDDARDLWAKLRERLNDTRVEIITNVQEAATIPWELIRDPKTDTPLALRASSFVRAHPQAAQEPKIPKADGQIRILLVICRPGGKEDVPFRSVASRLIKGLGEDARSAFRLDVLRPPTFEQLGLVLRAAKKDKQPYHVVHFDGHGTYMDAARTGTGELAAILSTLSTVSLSGSRSGAHGYLLFENPVLKENMQIIDGTSLGKLLVETDVPVLVLNACRSAHSEARAEPVQGDSAADDSHARVRALGSLAQEVMEAGAAGVVAMRYNVYVMTAARFVRDLYGSLRQGNALGEAVTLGRKQLAIEPMREIEYKPIPLQDWSVPVVYEAAPIALFPKQVRTEKLAITLNIGQATPSQRGLDANLPKSPDAGFFGRDETLLALDRAFDTQPVVLLWALAGNGKTVTAAEFARWYALTGGIQGPVLFTSFEQYKPLNRVLDQVGVVFGDALEQSGVHWLALDDNNRRDIALQVLKQIPVLWIWDNVEPVPGFPIGTKSAWSEAEQKELVDFLRDARNTRAKFLLTSRRDEEGWLGDLPRRIKVPPMPMQERVQLTRALAEKQGRSITDVEDWRLLLEFTQGNPLTITVLVGQALRKGFRTKEEISSFVSKLRAGEKVFQDEVSQGRAKSLGASLSYGFVHTFTEEEQKKLALLYFFQGFVNVDTLKVMGNPESDWCLPEVRGLSREDGIKLLDRASEIGLLTAHGGEGYYSIHPALPWFFKNMLDQYYPLSRQEKAARAYVESMGEMGSYYFKQYQEGNRDVIANLAAEEKNLLHARELAGKHSLWNGVIDSMQGLEWLYDQTGRRAEWERLVNEILPDFIDLKTNLPLPGREEGWNVVTQYRVLLARQERKWQEAENLQRLRVEWNSERTAPALAVPADKLDDYQRYIIANLGSSLHELAEIQRERGNKDCASTYKEALDMAERTGDKGKVAICAYNIGSAYVNIPDLRDLDESERWYLHSFELFDERDLQGRASPLGGLGNVAHERFKEARAAGKPEEELRRHLNTARDFYLKVLGMIPENAVDHLAVTHNQLGGIYYEVGDIDSSLSHSRESIRYDEMQGNLYGAARTRRNVAIAHVRADRFEEALEYAVAALRNYETFGDRAAGDIQKTRNLIAAIEQDLKKKGGST